MHRILQVLVPLMAVLALVWIWLDAIQLPEAQETRALHSTMAALATNHGLQHRLLGLSMADSA